jgi:ATP-dependent Clp protease protease subunit
MIYQPSNKFEHDSKLLIPDARLQVQYQRTREMTLDDLLLENRIVFLIGEISYRLAAEVIMKLLYLDNLKRGVEISLYINSPGGAVDDTMAIYDTMRFIGSPVATYCIGRAQSGGAVILAAGTKGRRHALPHAKIMLHQPWGGVTGQAEDIRIQAEEIIKSKKMINEVLAKHTGLTQEKLPKRPNAINTCPPKKPRPGG